jgi:hypothetical protein
MEENPMTTKKALVVVGVLVFLIGATLVIPAEKVGMKKKHTPLVLQSGEELVALQGDTDNNNTEDWKDLLQQNVSPKLSEEAKKVVVTPEQKKLLADPNNLTSSFSKNVYTATEIAKKNGTLTTQEKEDLATRLLAAEESKLIPTVYEITNLTIAKTESDTSRKAYGNVLGRIVKKAEAYKMPENDLKLIEAFNVKQDPAVLESLVVKKNNLELIIKDLLAVSVPNSAVPYHLLVINKMAQYKDVIENISKAKEDPIRASLGLRAYLGTTKSLASSFNSMRTYFALQGITYTTSEPGFYITGVTNTQ